MLHTSLLQNHEGFGHTGKYVPQPRFWEVSSVVLKLEIRPSLKARSLGGPTSIFYIFWQVSQDPHEGNIADIADVL